MTVSGQRSSNVPFNNEQIIEAVQKWALELGFQKAAVAKINIDDDSNRLKAWLAAGFHGTMSYMRRHLKTREQPDLLVPGMRAEPPDLAFQVGGARSIGATGVLPLGLGRQSIEVSGHLR